MRPTASESVTEAYKVLTHDWRSPIYRGEPVCAGALPFELPTVDVDVSDAYCGAGWNASRDAADALRAAGLWPDGRPSRLLLVSTVAPVVERAGRVRAATWTLVREVDVEPHVYTLSRAFGGHADEMAREQLRWRAALARPRRDEAVVAASLERALRKRGLPWSLRRFATAQAARDAWDAWAAWAARDDRNTWAARDAWDARAARDAWAAWDAWDALTWFYAARRDWIVGAPDRYSAGLIDAYEHGLATCVPIGDDTLGWAMEVQDATDSE